jgi:hypothetical protein
MKNDRENAVVRKRGCAWKFGKRCRIFLAIGSATTVEFETIATMEGLR